MKFFDSTTSVAIFLAMKSTVTLVAESKNFIMPQHLPGILNSIADWLSFEGEERRQHGTGNPVENPIAYDCQPSNVVTNRILSSFPQLVPAAFTISHLPKEVISFACQAIQIFESCLMLKQKGEPNHPIEYGGGGAASVRSLSEEKVPCLMEYCQTNPTSSYGPSLKCTESQTSARKEVILENVRSRWSVALSRKPHALWSRRCGTITGGVPSTTQKVPVSQDLAPTSKT